MLHAPPRLQLGAEIIRKTHWSHCEDIFCWLAREVRGGSGCWAAQTGQERRQRASSRIVVLFRNITLPPSEDRHRHHSLAGGCGDWHLAQLLLAAAPRHGPIISSNSHDPATESFVEHNKKNKISRFTATTSHNWMAKVGCFSLSEPTVRGGPRPQLGADLSSQSWHRLLVFLQPPAGRSVKIFMYLFGSCKNYRRI